jgi:DNA (cytosine-5)-methyltransferase 1
VDTNRGINQLALCAGYDGIGLGLGLAGIDIQQSVYVEIEAFAAKNLADKIEKGKVAPGVIWPNLKTFPFKRFRGCFDILTAGFPCQPFSAAGNRKGDEDPRHLWPFIKTGIEECQPDIVFLENVRGLMSAKLKGSHWADPEGTPVLLHVLRELERIHYTAETGIFSAEEVGARHRRERVFIMAHRESIGHRGGSGCDRNNKNLRVLPEEVWKNFRPETQRHCDSFRVAGVGETQHPWEQKRIIY